MEQASEKSNRGWMAGTRILALWLFGAAFTLSLAHGKTGGLYLVGLGPGDPELATVKAIHLLQDADLIYSFGGDILDRFAAQLKNKEVRKLPFNIFARGLLRDDKHMPDGAKIEKPPGMDKERQRLLSEVRRAVGAGKLVVFIDSGDPLIYGPWVWMLEEFRDLKPEVVPGISSFNAGLAALKRDGTWAPNTHSVILTTDRLHNLDRLEALAEHQCSMAIFTHRTEFKAIFQKLRTHYKPETPVAIVIYAGYKTKQTVIRGDLTSIESLVDPKTLPMEHIIFVGDFLSYDINKN